jgi:hypothetical protein
LKALLNGRRGEIGKIYPTCAGRDFRNKVHTATFDPLNPAWVGSLVSWRAVQNKTPNTDLLVGGTIKGRLKVPATRLDRGCIGRVSLLGCLDAFKSRNREAGAVAEAIHDQLQRTAPLSGMPGDATRLGKFHRHGIYFIVSPPRAYLEFVPARTMRQICLLLMGAQMRFCF